MNSCSREFKSFVTLIFTIFLFAHTTALNASGYNDCIGRITDNFDTFCEQTSRHASLEIDWSFLENISIANKTLKEKQITKEIIIAELSGINNTANIENTVHKLAAMKSHQWPRPKILDRSYEVAVNSLDLDGKRDLRSCTLQEMENLSKISESLPTHQLNAILNFSNTHLKGDSSIKANSGSSLNSKSCKQLLSLILGRA